MKYSTDSHLPRFPGGGNYLLETFFMHARRLSASSFLVKHPIAAAAAILAVSQGVPQARAALIANAIPGVTAQAFQAGDSLDPNGDGGVNNVTNGDGLTVGNINAPSTWTHDNNWQAGWQGNGSYAPDSAGAGSATTTGAWFIADLGSARGGLASMYIWNVREVVDRGSRNVDIFYATSPTATITTGVAGYDFTSGGWTPLLMNHTIPQGAGGGGTPADSVVSLAGVTSARYIGFRINSNYNSNIRTGFAEIQFTTVPEPSVAVMGLLAGAGLLARRRRM